MFNYRKFNVNIVPVNDRVRNDALEKTSVLTNYFSSRYPELKFSATEFPLKSFREEFEQYVEERGISMLVVPNKKKSVFSRLFNPGIAHRILFEKDIPMLVLPV